MDKERVIQQLKLKKQIEKQSITNLHAGVYGDFKYIQGDVSNISGNVSEIYGDVCGIIEILKNN